jgi:hypothetical protein
MRTGLVMTGFLIISEGLVCRSLDSLLMSVSTENIVLIGETHFISENDSIQYSIVKRLVTRNESKVTLVLEWPQSMGYFIDRFFQLDDSVSLKKYLSYYTSGNDSVMSIAARSAYHQICKYQVLNKSHPQFELKCADVEKRFLPSAFTLMSILAKYQINHDEVNDFIIKIQSASDSILNESAFISLNEIALSLSEEALVSLDSLSIEERDLNYLKEILKNCTSNARAFEERNERMYNWILSQRRADVLFIGIFGNMHVNKFYNDTISVFGNVPSLGSFLDMRVNSPYFNRVISLYTHYLTIELSDGSIGSKLNPLFHFKEEIDQYDDLSFVNSKFMLTNALKFVYLDNAYDGIILIRKGHALWK